MADSSIQIAIKADTTDLNAKVALTKAALAQATTALKQTGTAAVQSGADLKTLLPVVTQQAQAVATYRTQLARLTTTHHEHASAVGTNRMAYMEFGHVAKASFDELAAGASPLRVLQTEGARAVQAFTELSAGARASVLAIAPIAAVVAIVGAALVAVTVKIEETINAFHRLDDTTAAYGRSAEAVSGASRDLASSVSDKYWISYAAAANDVVAPFERLTTASKDVRDGLAGIAPAYAKLYSLAQDKGSDALAHSFGSVSGIEEVISTLGQLTGPVEQQLHQAQVSHDLAAAQSIGLGVLTDKLQAYTTKVQQNAHAMSALNLIGAAGGGVVPSIGGADAIPGRVNADELVPNGQSDEARQAVALAAANRDVLGVQNQIEEKTAAILSLQKAVTAATKPNSGVDASTIALLKTEISGATDQLGKLTAKEDGGSEYGVIEEQLRDQLRAKQLFGDQALAYSKKYYTQELALVQGGGQNEAAARRRIGDELYTIEAQQNAKGLSAAKKDNSELLAQQREAAAESNQIVRANATTQLQVARLGVEAQKDDLQQQLDAGRITSAQKAAQEIALVQQLAQIDSQILANEQDLHTASLVASAQYHNQLVLQAKQEALQIAAIKTQEANHEAELARQAVAKQREEDNQIAQTLGSSLAGMLTQRRSFVQSAAELGDRLVEKAIVWGLEELFSTVRTQIAKTAAVTVGSQAQVAATAAGAVEGAAIQTAINEPQFIQKAGLAAANTYAAVSGIPIIGPVLAPIAAAGAFVAVMAFSAQGGAESVPYDNAPFLLHKNEMVLPSGLADRVRNMSDDHSSGDTHFHGDFNFQQQPDQDANDLYDTFTRRLRNDHRNGAFAFG